jgi:hypothetical protein
MDSHECPVNPDKSPPATATGNQAGTTGLEPSLHVIDLYARLAAGRAVDTRRALRSINRADELLIWSAQALEDAAGILTFASEMYAGDREGFSRLLHEQAQALVVLAAQFEQAADLARHKREHE